MGFVSCMFAAGTRTDRIMMDGCLWRRFCATPTQMVGLRLKMTRQSPADTRAEENSG